MLETCDQKPSGKIFKVGIDHRERKSGAAGAFEEMEQVETSYEHFEVGDYLVDQTLLVERKTLIDFAASIKDGRLFRQAKKFIQQDKTAVLILEGVSGDLAESGMRREAIQGAMITLCLIFRLPILRAMNGRESAKLMLYAAGQIREFSRGAVVRKGKRPKGKKRRQYWVLQGLPGVGPERARRLLEEFGGIEAIMTANAKALARVEGIGRKTAESIRHVVRDQRATYGEFPPDDFPV